MSDDKYSNAFMDKLNKAYMSCCARKTDQLDMSKFRVVYWRKRHDARRTLDMIAQKLMLVKKRKQYESSAIDFLTKRTKKQIQQTHNRNDEYRKLHDQMKDMTKSLEEEVEILEQTKAQYLKHVDAYKASKDVITSVTKRWPTVISEFELMRRLETLIKQKIRFSEEYKEMNQLQEAERQKLLYETAQEAEMDMIVLSNKLDELKQEQMDVTVAIQEEADKFNRIMDTSSEVEMSVSEVRLGCLRLYNLTKPTLISMDPFEELTIVLEFGHLLASVAEALEKLPKT